MAKRCMSPSCYQIVRDEGETRCEKHRKVRKKEVQTKRNFNVENSNIYNSQRWRRLSQKKRVVDPFCEMCLADGRETIANVVDHIHELSDGGDPYKWGNLKSMCHSCHNNKTRKEQRKRKEHSKG